MNKVVTGQCWKNNLTQNYASNYQIVALTSTFFKLQKKHILSDFSLPNSLDSNLDQDQLAWLPVIWIALVPFIFHTERFKVLTKQDP